MPKELRGYIRRIINNIQPARESVPHNRPIKIDGNDALTYEVICDYMITKYNDNVVEVDKDAELLNILRKLERVNKEQIRCRQP